MSEKMGEVYKVQNPALGAAILWRFVCGYYSKNKEPVPFPLLFYILPIIFREDLRNVIKTTRKSLSKLSEKLFESKRNDELYTINNSAIALRPLSLQALNVSFVAKLLMVDASTALVYPIFETSSVGKLSDYTKEILKASEKLGQWCSEITLVEFCNLLKVRL